jgi:hypothetical protein
MGRVQHRNSENIAYGHSSGNPSFPSYGPFSVDPCSCELLSLFSSVDRTLTFLPNYLTLSYSVYQLFNARKFGCVYAVNSTEPLYSQRQYSNSNWRLRHLIRSVRLCGRRPVLGCGLSVGGPRRFLLNAVTADLVLFILSQGF